MAEKVANSFRIERQDTGLTTSTTKSPLNLFPQVSDCKYTPCYCEENVWHLCQNVSKSRASELQNCKVVFISNDQRKVPLWRQKSGQDEDKLVFWDYHVIFLYNPDDRCLVYDQDSELPFPTYFHKYVTETFRTDHILKPEYFRYFRVIPASTFLQHFASDRRHMRRADGSWLQPPPDYPSIKTDSWLTRGSAEFDLMNELPAVIVTSLKNLNSQRTFRDIGKSLPTICQSSS